MSTENIDEKSKNLFTSKVNSIKSLYSSSSAKIVLSNSGVLNQDKVNSISSFVESELENYGTSKKVVKRVFNIIIEILQNIILHGEIISDSNQLSYFIVAQNDNIYNIHSGNIVKIATAVALNKRLNIVKSLNENDLKNKYRDVLVNGELSEKGGAGLGFLTIALKSNNIDFEFQDIDQDFSLFSMHIQVID
jgi:hypothetical protein